MPDFRPVDTRRLLERWEETFSLELRAVLDILFPSVEEQLDALLRNCGNKAMPIVR